MADFVQVIPLFKKNIKYISKVLLKIKCF